MLRKAKRFVNRPRDGRRRPSRLTRHLRLWPHLGARTLPLEVVQDAGAPAGAVVPTPSAEVPLVATAAPISNSASAALPERPASNTSSEALGQAMDVEDSAAAAADSTSVADAEVPNNVVADPAAAKQRRRARWSKTTVTIETDQGHVVLSPRPEPAPMHLEVENVPPPVNQQQEFAVPSVPIKSGFPQKTLAAPPSQRLLELSKPNRALLSTASKPVQPLSNAVPNKALSSASKQIKQKKFDLSASLSKKPAWKMYTGRLHQQAKVSAQPQPA